MRQEYNLDKLNNNILNNLNTNKNKNVTEESNNAIYKYKFQNRYFDLE